MNLPRQFPVVQTGNQLWIGTPHGLYQYNRSEDSFKRFVIPGTRPAPEVRMLAYHKEWLWCVLDTGLAALQTELNDWLVFDTTNGLPAATVSGITGQEDFVWVSSANGFARFDLLIEQWEIYREERGLPDRNVQDLLSTGDHLWMITGNGFSQYDPRFEKWRHFEVGNEEGGYPTRLFPLGDELWLVLQRGLLRFNPQLEKIQSFFPPYLQSGELLELFIEDDRLWAITRSGLYFFEQRTSVWREFEGNSTLRDVEILGGSMNPQQIWILTPRSTLLWSRDQKTWEVLDYSSGLSSSGHTSAFTDGDLTLLLKPDGLEYRRSARDPWRRYAFETGDVTGTGRGFVGDLLDNPDGARIGMGPFPWLWQGTRVTFLQNLQRTFPDDHSPTEWDRTSGERYDIKSQLDLLNGRRITAFYNNVDYNETRYGARFRGNDSDIVREFTWGDFRREAQVSLFSQPAELYGSALWLQYGPKTERFKRSLLTVRGTTAEVRSKKTYEHLEGTSESFSRTRADRDYVSNRFFRVPGLDPSTRPDHFEVFVDDGTSSTNNANTLTGTTIGGVTGDFDRLRPIEDYSLSLRASSVLFSNLVLPQWTLVVRFDRGGQLAEEVLQDGSGLSTVRENFYHIGAQKIIPSSFQMEILDSLGIAVPLHSFGLDDDENSIVDSRWCDFDQGLLWFPADRPFLEAVYDQSSTQSYYRLRFSGRSEFTIIQLAHTDLVRASETIWLDGMPAVAGNDFVLDYTNGTLIFVREGVITPDTRMEIEYEYYEPTGTQLSAGGIQFSPSDNFYALGEWQTLSGDTTHLITVQGEVRQPLGAFDLRVVPAVAYQTAEQSFTGMSVEGLLSSSWLRIQTRYEDYAREYGNLYRLRSLVGEVHRRVQLSGSLDISQDVRITGEWRETSGFTEDSIGRVGGAPRDMLAGGSILFHRQDLPGIQLSYVDGKTDSPDSTARKRFVQDLLEYQLPRAWSEALLLTGVKLEQYLRFGRQSTSNRSGEDEHEFLQAYLRLTALISEQFQVGFFYRRNTVEGLAHGGHRTPLSRAERLLADIAIADWRALQVNGRLENSLQQYAHGDTGLSNRSLRQFLQANLRLLPGEVWEPLSPLFFELNLTQALDQSGLREGLSSTDLWRLRPPAQGDDGSFILTRTNYLKNEFRPGAVWFLQSLFEWTWQELGGGGSRLERRSWRLNEKLDIKLGFETRLTLQYRQGFQDEGQDRTTKDYEPSLWVEQRWSQDLISTFQVLHRQTWDVDGAIEGRTREWSSNADLVWRSRGLLGIRYAEIRQSVGGVVTDTRASLREHSLLVSSATSIDLYPLPSLIFRLRVDVSRRADLAFAKGGYTSVGGNARLTIQL